MIEARQRVPWRWWALIFLVPVLLIVAGCDATLQKKVDTVEVPVVVTEKCIARADVPAIPRSHMVRGGNVEQNAAGASADVRELARLAEKQNALLLKCSE